MATEERKIQLGVAVDASGAKAGFADIKQGAEGMAQAVAQAGQVASKGVDGITAASEKLTTSQSRLVESIKRTAILTTEGKAAYLEQKAAIAGVSDAVSPYLAKIKQAEAAQVNMGLSAKQTAFALRGIPAQFTDIATSIASGQKPMLVLLQQGGQIKDMFGGIGPAARAMGGYLLGLINPLTIAAGAIAAVGYAAFQGAKELRAFEGAVALTGNAVGLSVSQFSSMRDSLAGIAGTKGKAAEVLTEIAASGKFAEAAVRGIAEAAILMEKATGQATAKTIEQFAELAKSPAEASAKLNEQYNYLTASVYKQIKALEDQGRAVDAANLAENTYAEAMKGRAQTVVENAGLMEKAWRGVTGGAKTAWDAMLGIGRTESLGEQLAGVKAKIAGLTGAKGTGPGDNAFAAAQLAALRLQETELEKQVGLVARVTAQKAEQNRLEQLGIAFAKQGDEFLTKKEKQEREVNKARIEGNDLVKAGMLTQVELEKRIAGIREKYKESAKGGAKAIIDPVVAAAAKQYTDTMRDLLKIQQEAAGKAEDLSKTQAKLRAEMESPAWASYSRQQREQIINAAALSQAEEDHAKAVKESAEAAKVAAAEYAKYLAIQDADLEKLREQVQSEAEHVASIGLSKDAVAELAATKLDAAAATKIKMAAEEEERDGDLRLAQVYRDQAAELQKLASLKRTGGVKDAAQDIRKEMQKTADSINESLTDALLRGFESGKSFAENFRDTLKNMFSTLVLRPIIQGVMSPISGAVSGMLGGGAAQGGMGALSGVGNLASMYGGASAIGSAFMSGYTGIAGLGAAGAGGSLMMGGTAAAGTMLATDAMGATVLSGAAGATGAGGVAAGASAAMAAIPVAGWIALAAVALYSIFSKDGGGPKNIGVSSSNPLLYDPTRTDTTAASNTAAAQSTTGIIQAYTNAAQSLGVAAEKFDAAVLFSIDDKGAGDAMTGLVTQAFVNGRMVYDRENAASGSDAYKNVGRTPEELQAAMATAASRAVLAALQATDMPSKLADYFASLDPLQLGAEQITAAVTVATNAKQVWSAFEALGPAFAYVGDMSVATTTKLIEAGDGIAALASNLSSYFDNFYSDEEKRQHVATQISVTLAKSDITLTPEDILGMDRAEFRAMVEQFARLGPAGEEAYLALLSVNGAFASITPAAQAAAGAIDAVATAAKRFQSATRTALQDVQDSLRGMHEAVSAANAGVSDARGKIYDAYSSAQDRLNGLLEQSRQATLAFANSLTDYLAGLSMGRFATETPAGQYQALQRRLFAQADLARGGDQGARDGLTGAADSFLTAAQARSTSAAEFALDRARVRTLLDGVMSSLPASAQPGAGPTLDDQILAAQQEVADYLALANETGTNIETATLSVADNIEAMRESYEAARAEQDLANARLDVALTALEAFGLTESTLTALLNGQTGASIGDFATALGVSDDTINTLQAAIGFTDDELQALSDALNVTVAPEVYAALGTALGIHPTLVAELASGLGVSPIQMLALNSALGLNPADAQMLLTVLSLTPEQQTALATALGVDPTQLAPLATILGVDPALVSHLGTVVGISDAAQDIIGALGTVIGFSDAAEELGLSLPNIAGFSPAALETIEALAERIGLSPEARQVYEDLAARVGFNPEALNTIGALGESVGLHAGLDAYLSTALGLSSGAIDAINALLGATTARNANVSLIEQAYASIGRTGYGSGANQIDAAGFQYWLDALMSGAVTSTGFMATFQSEAAAYVKAKPEDPISQYVKPYLQSLGIQGLATGTNYVPQDMLAQIHEGEAIVPKQYNPAAGAWDTSKMEAKLDQVTKALEASNERLAKVEQYTGSIDQRLFKVAPDGDRVRTYEVGAPS